MMRKNREQKSTVDRSLEDREEGEGSLHSSSPDSAHLLWCWDTWTTAPRRLTAAQGWRAATTTGTGYCCYCCC